MSKYYVNSQIYSDENDSAVLIAHSKCANLEYRFYICNGFDDEILVTVHEINEDMLCKDCKFQTAYVVYVESFEESLSGICLTEKGVEFFKQYEEKLEGKIK